MGYGALATVLMERTMWHYTRFIDNAPDHCAIIFSVSSLKPQSRFYLCTINPFTAFSINSYCYDSPDFLKVMQFR